MTAACGACRCCGRCTWLTPGSPWRRWPWRCGTWAGCRNKAWPPTRWPSAVSAALILAMIARVSLGHTGRLLQPSGAVVAGFVLVLLAGACRVGLVPFSSLGLALSALLWCSAFAFLSGATPGFYWGQGSREGFQGRPSRRPLHDRWSMRQGLAANLRLAEGITRGARRLYKAAATPLQITVSLRNRAMLTLNINGRGSRSWMSHADMPLLWVLRDVAAPDRHEIRLRHGPVRRLHGACRRRGRCAPASRRSIAVAHGRDHSPSRPVGNTQAGRKVQQAWAGRRCGAVRLLPVRADHVAPRR